MSIEITTKIDTIFFLDFPRGKFQGEYQTLTHSIMHLAIFWGAPYPPLARYST